MEYNEIRLTESVKPNGTGGITMNEQFYELPEEKQMRIINAALEVFAKNEYKRAVTDDIAAKAGISKGLLFYYFHNKKSLYQFLYNYAAELVKNAVMDQHYEEKTDFFEMIEYAADVKVRLLKKTPYLMEFAMRAFYAMQGDQTGELQLALQYDTEQLYLEYFNNIDYSAFRDDVDPKRIYQMITWMTEGYMLEKKLQDSFTEADIDAIMEECRKWIVMMKRVAYKEEFL